MASMESRDDKSWQNNNSPPFIYNAQALSLKTKRGLLVGEQGKSSISKGLAVGAPVLVVQCGYL